MKNFIKKLLSPTGYTIVKKSTMVKFDEHAGKAKDLNFLAAMPPAHVGRLMECLPSSKAQIRQDLFVLSSLDFKRNGFFVEFGAASGRELSNTWLLEKTFGWQGLLAEPARCWHESLAANRACAIDHRCVWKKTGEQLQFSETSVAVLSAIAGYETDDSTVGATRYDVETVTLQDLLEQHKAPRELDYLSIDTEGSEFDILREFDFNRYSLKVVTCEHNNSPLRAEIFALLSSFGYARKYEGLSEFDDWYVRS